MDRNISKSAKLENIERIKLSIHIILPLLSNPEFVELYSILIYYLVGISSNSSTSKFSTNSGSSSINWEILSKIS